MMFSLTIIPHCSLYNISVRIELIISDHSNICILLKPPTREIATKNTRPIARNIFPEYTVKRATSYISTGSSAHSLLSQVSQQDGIIRHTKRNRYYFVQIFFKVIT